METNTFVHSPDHQYHYDPEPIITRSFPYAPLEILCDFSVTLGRNEMFSYESGR